MSSGNNSNSTGRSFSQLYSQARESVRSLDLGTKIESGRQAMNNEVKARELDQKFQRLGSAVGSATGRVRESVQNIDVKDTKEKILGSNLDRKLQNSLQSLGGASQRFGCAVGSATGRIRDSVQNIDVKDTRERLGTAIGGVTTAVGERFRSDSTDEDLHALNKRLRHDRQVLEATNAMQEAEAACMGVIRSHLEDFIENNPNGTYEEWLSELHPDNDYDGKLLEGFSELDHRFYVKESDHLIIWNENLGGIRQEVAPRYRMGNTEAGAPIIDLLGPSDEDDAPGLVGMSGSSEDATDVLTNIYDSMDEQAREEVKEGQSSDVFIGQE